MKTTCFLAVLCSILLGACGGERAVQAKIAEAAATGKQAAQAVEAYFKKRGGYPAHLEEAFVRPATLKDIKLMSVDRKSGVVRVTMSFAPVDGKSILFVPARSKDKSFTWRCTSEDIDVKYLPEACRPESAGKGK